MLAASHKPIATVLLQHAEDAIVLRNIRSGLITAPHVKLHHLKRFDDRLVAHLDALDVAGDEGWSTSARALENPGTSEIFVATACALLSRRADRLEQLLAVTEAQREATAGLVSAFGWVPAAALKGIVPALLASDAPFRRAMGLAACSVHRVDPGNVLARALRDVTPDVRSRAYKAAAQLGMTDLSTVCAAAINEEQDEPRCWATWAAVLLGSRGGALDVLIELALQAGAHRERALRLALQVVDTERGRATLQQLAAVNDDVRWLIFGSGVLGDPFYIPWLVRQMTDDALARLAGEAFTAITGADLEMDELERKPPESLETGPNDNPEDTDVRMDIDDGLLWPDVERIERWWADNAGSFQTGIRYFLGAPVTQAHCAHVLKNGYQRQRILAAHYLCLLEPGTPLFNTSAPAWRQKRLLAQLA